MHALVKAPGDLDDQPFTDFYRLRTRYCLAQAGLVSLIKRIEVEEMTHLPSAWKPGCAFPSLVY